MKSGKKKGEKPVLVEPVVDVHLEVHMVAEVAGAGACHEEAGLLLEDVRAAQLLV